MLELIRHHNDLTRADLVTMTQSTRQVVWSRLTPLLELGLVRENRASSTAGVGRRPSRLSFNSGSGVVLAADVGIASTRAALCDLAGNVLAEHAFALAVTEGPDRTLPLLERNVLSLLSGSPLAGRELHGIGIGIPAAVAAGRWPLSPATMSGWERVSIADWFAARHPVTVRVDTDVNVMALGERRRRSDAEPFLFVKFGSGVACALVADGQLHRGHRGSAGNIGHMRVEGREHVPCRCGNRGCLETVAGGYRAGRPPARRGPERP